MTTQCMNCIALNRFGLPTNLCIEEDGMPNWTNRTYTDKKENPLDCTTCSYLSSCGEADKNGLVLVRLQAHCCHFWDRVVRECMDKALDELEMTEEEKSWAKFYDFIKRKNQLNRLFSECSVEPECPSPRQYDWKYYDVDVTIPFNRLTVTPYKSDKKPWYKRFWDFLCSIPSSISDPDY